jgi:hypothetical protein
LRTIHNPITLGRRGGYPLLLLTLTKLIIMDDAYYVGIHRNSFQAGIPAKIVGMKFITPEYNEKRLCYHIKFSDGSEDWAPVKDKDHYKIISFEDILYGNIPDVSE